MYSEAPFLRLQHYLARRDKFGGGRKKPMRKMLGEIRAFQRDSGVSFHAIQRQRGQRVTHGRKTLHLLSPLLITPPDTVSRYFRPVPAE